MRVDFYQLGAIPGEQVIASLAEKLIGAGERLLVIAGDEAQLAALDRLLWQQGGASFVPHGLAGGMDDARQPVLLATDIDPCNQARNLLIADGKWRDAALSFARAFYLFDQSSIEEARGAWRSLAGDFERHYWAHDGNRWVKKSGSSRERS